MIGYHYTNATFHESILKNGLQPKLITGIEKLPEGTKGVWLFNRRLVGDVEKAFVLRQIVKFDCSKVTLYEVQYDEEDRRVGGFTTVGGEHVVNIEGRVYENKCTVIAGPVPITRVKFIGEFSLDFKPYEQSN